MFRRCFVIFLAVVLSWTAMSTFESGSPVIESKAAHFVDSVEATGVERSGSVSDHHLDDVGAATHDLPDQDILSTALLANVERLAGSPLKLIGELCSPDLPLPQRPPCTPA